jgi:hypothetical protein
MDFSFFGRFAGFVAAVGSSILARFLLGAVVDSSVGRVVASGSVAAS